MSAGTQLEPAPARSGAGTEQADRPGRNELGTIRIADGVVIKIAAMAAGSIIVIIEVIAVAAHAGPVVVHWHTWYQWGQKTRWNASVVRIWSAILIVIGVVLLAMELKPRRVSRLPLRSMDQATDAALTRSGLAGTLRAAASGIDGITGATVTVRRRRAMVAARSAARGRAATSALRDPVTQAVRDRLDDLNLLRPPRLRVRVMSRKR